MEETKRKGIARVRYLLFLLKPYWKYGKVFMLVSFFMSAIVQPLSAYLTTMLPQRAIDAVMTGAARKETLLLIGGYTAAIALMAAAQKIVDMTYFQVTRTKLNSKIKNDVNEKALYTDYRYYDNPDFFTKFIFAQEQFPNHAGTVMFLLPEIIKGIVTVAAMGVVIVSVGPALLGVTLAFVILNAVVGLPTLKPEADLGMNLTNAWRPLDYVSRMLKQKENAAELRSSGAGVKFLHTISKVTENFNAVYRVYIKKTAPFFLVQGIVAPIQTACVLAYVILFVIDGDSSKIGLYASLTVASATVASNLSSIGYGFTQLLQNTLYGERVASFFEAKSEIEPTREGAVAPPDGVYECEFRDVSFGYENARFVIDHLNLQIKPGQRIAIVGENGAGKTTLTKLLLRLYDVNDGEILINGKNIKEYDVHALRLRIGISFQDVRVLAMSLRDNLTVYNQVSDEKLMEVIEKLGLEGVLQKADGDLDKMVSREFIEDGIALSGGEAQRVSLARLFTGSFGLLVLDEPSSALDPLAEYRLMQTILDASNTATTVMIAHRLSTVRDFDVIYHMENGRIIESGTHDELMAAKGKYFEMFTRQAENYQNSKKSSL